MFSNWSWDGKRKSILDGFRRVVVNCREFAFRITRQHVVERQRKDVCANWLWRARLTGPACNAGFYDPKSAGLYRPPMVSVKLPKSVLVVFHLWRATKLPNFFQVKSRAGC